MKPPQPYRQPTNSRFRKQKCGGFTHGIKCRPCTTRKVKCSFQEEVKDPRHNPYLRLRSPGFSSTSFGRTPAVNKCLETASATLIPALTTFSGDVQPVLTGIPAGGPSTSVTDEEIPKQLDSLRSRYIPYLLLILPA